MQFVEITNVDHGIVDSFQTLCNRWLIAASIVIKKIGDAVYCLDDNGNAFCKLSLSGGRIEAETLGHSIVRRLAFLESGATALETYLNSDLRAVEQEVMAAGRK